IACIVDFRDAQRDRARRSCERIAQVDQDPGVMVLAACPEPGFASEWALAAAKQSLEEVAERPAFKTAGKVEAGIPVGRRPELLARLPFLAELIVGGTLLWVAEHLIGLADFLEAAFSSWLLADVGMEFPGKLAKGPLDLVLCRAAFQPQNLIVVLVFHEISEAEGCGEACALPSGIAQRRTQLGLADVQRHHGRRTKLSLTARTPSMASAATRIALLSASDLATPQRSTIPSLTRTFSSHGRAHACFCRSA